MEATSDVKHVKRQSCKRVFAIRLAAESRVEVVFEKAKAAATVLVVPAVLVESMNRFFCVLASHHLNALPVVSLSYLQLAMAPELR